MDKIEGGGQSLQDNFRKLADGQQRLEQGMATLQTNLGKLPDATGALGEGAGQLADGNDQLNETWPKLVSGIQTLQNGTDQLVSGSGRLASNMNAFSQGISDLTDGQRRLADGTDQLTDGAGQLADGSETLKSGLAYAHDEVAKTPTTDAHAKQFSQPVTAIDSSHQTVDTFGSGFAPYFISLGFFIGALILTIVYDLGRPAGPATTGIGIAVSKLFIAFLMSLGQMLILDTVVLIGLDLQVDNVWVFLGFSLLVSMTFMTLITFLAGTFDNVGRFIALVILILQLVTCGGAYAIQLIPDLIQPLATVLPTTYSVNGFRNIIDGSQQNLLNVNASVLAGFLVLHLMLTMIAFTVKFRINRRAAQAVRPTAESSVSQ
jgi:putative membrane protein